MRKNIIFGTIIALLALGFQLKAQNYALNFDGLDDKVGTVDATDLNPTSALTVEAWINAAEWNSNVWGSVIIGKQAGSPDRGYSFTAGQAGKVEFTVSIDGQWKSATSPAILGANAWYHVAGVFDGSTIKVYINGTLSAEQDAVGEMDPATGAPLFIGDNPGWPGRFWNGKLDEIRIWSVARSQEEIQASMNEPLSGTEEGLVAYYPMNEGSGDTTADASNNEHNGVLLNMDENAWVDGFVSGAADVGILGIASPSRIGTGFGEQEKIKVEFKNLSSIPVNQVEVSYQIAGGNTITETVDTEIEPFGTYIHCFQNQVDLSAMEEIEISASVTVEGDSNPANNSITETIAPTLDYTLFDRKRHNYGGYGQTQTHTLYMPEDLSNINKIYLHIDLDCPTGGCDPWDQPAKISIAKGTEIYEITRYITPFGVACGGWTWDITDFRSLLVDKVDWISYIQVWGASGWLLTARLELQEGTPEYAYVKVNKLWNDDNVVYGDPNVSYDLPEQDILIHNDTEAAKIRMTTTGHGQGNTSNAAEFAEFTHHIWINGASTFEQHLWKPDCAENSCSPQSGTYQYARAGWCPGQDVQPWEWDLAGHFNAGENINIDYVLAEYTNHNNTGYNGGSHTEPHFRIHSYFIEYSNTDIFDKIEEHENANNNVINTYPNPTHSSLHIATTNNEPIQQIGVFNISGQSLRHIQLTDETNYLLDMKHFTKGIYFIEVSTAKQKSMVKVIKN